MEILVTGGAGFVGSHLCERLVQQGHNVVSLDNYFTGSENNHVQGVEYIHCSTVNLNVSVSDLYDYKPDMVYHLGEYSRVEQSFEDMDLVFEYNKVGTYEVLEFVRRTGAKLIYAGSSTKFVDEPGYVQSPYAWSKASNTEFVIKYAEWFGIDYAITYFYNNFGPREIKTGKYATVIAKFLEKIKSGEKITVTAPGTQRRNFTHVQDTIDALILVGEYGSGDEYGIGHDHSYSILDIIKILEIDEYEITDMKPGNRMESPVLTDKIKALGWQPKISLKDYLTRELEVIKLAKNSISV